MPHFRNLGNHKHFSSKYLCSAAPAAVRTHPKRQTIRRTSLEFHHKLSPGKILEILVGAKDLSFGSTENRPPMSLRGEGTAPNCAAPLTIGARGRTMEILEDAAARRVACC